MKNKLPLLLLLCFMLNLKVQAQKLAAIDSCSLHHLVRHPEKLKMSSMMDCKRVSKEFQLTQSVVKAASESKRYSSTFGEFEITNGPVFISIKYKNKTGQLEFDSIPKYTLVGLKKEGEKVLFLLKSEFSSTCKPYISFNFCEDKKGGIQEVTFTQWDYVEGR